MPKFEIGQEVKAQFLTLPRICTGDKKSRDDACPIRDGIVTYIHPENHFICVKTHTGGGDVTEAFKPWEVMA